MTYGEKKHISLRTIDLFVNPSINTLDILKWLVKRKCQVIQPKNSEKETNE